MGKLRLFDSDWPVDKRLQIIEQINTFADQQEILPAIRRYETLLEPLPYEHDIGASTRKSIEILLSCGRGILVAAGELTVMPFHNFDELRSFLVDIKSAKTQDDVDSVIKTTSTIIGVFDQKILKDADIAFGEILVDIQKRNPFLQAQDSPF